VNDFSDQDADGHSGPTSEGPITLACGTKTSTIWRAAVRLQDLPLGEISRDAAPGDSSPPDSSETLPDMSANVQAIVQRAASLVELQSVIQELQKLHDFLHAEGERLEQEISEYAQISRRVTSTKRAITDSIPKDPTLQDMAASVAPEHIHRALAEPQPTSVSSDKNSGRFPLSLNWARARPIK
jgi:hypothetical protein